VKELHKDIIHYSSLFSVPIIFIALPTATLFSMELTNLDPNGGTVSIPFTFIVDRDYFGNTFPSAADIQLESLDTSLCVIGTSFIRLYSITDTEVTESTDPDYGPIITVNDNIGFTYTSDLANGAQSCNFAITLEPSGRDERINPFFTGSLVYQPGTYFWRQIPNCPMN